MKKTLKALAVTGVVLVATMGLFGCKEERECASCGEVKSCDKYEVLGEEVWLCDDCHELVEALGDYLK